MRGKVPGLQALSLPEQKQPARPDKRSTNPGPVTSLEKQRPRRRRWGWTLSSSIQEPEAS